MCRNREVRRRDAGGLSNKQLRGVSKRCQTLNLKRRTGGRHNLKKKGIREYRETNQIKRDYSQRLQAGRPRKERYVLRAGS